MSGQRSHHISKDSCNSSVLLLRHVAACESSPHWQCFFLIAGAEWKSEWISGLHSWLLWGALDDPDDPLQLFLSSKGSSQIPMPKNSQAGSYSIETIILFH